MGCIIEMLKIYIQTLESVLQSNVYNMVLF